MYNPISSFEQGEDPYKNTCGSKINLPPIKTYATDAFCIFRFLALPLDVQQLPFIFQLSLTFLLRLLLLLTLKS